MLIDKEGLISDLKNYMCDPKELHDVLMTIEEQPATKITDIINEFIELFNHHIIDLCNSSNINDEVIEIRGRLYIRVVTIGKILDQCVKGGD